MPNPPSACKHSEGYNNEGPRTRVVYSKIKYGKLPKECKNWGKYG